MIDQGSRRTHPKMSNFDPIHTDPTTTLDPFTSFNLTDATYKTISSHPISCTIFTPKTPHPGPRPVIVRWHGGFLFTGSRTFADWWPAWLIEYALHHSAILISPDYRLLPEATGSDILSDIEDFWAWLPRELPFLLASLQPTPMEADWERVMVTGDSAGGWCAVHSVFAVVRQNQALEQGVLETKVKVPEVRIRAAAIAYGMLDMRSAWWTQPGEKHPFGAPSVPSSVLDAHVAAVQSGKAPRVVSSATPPERQHFPMAALQAGLFEKYIGSERYLYPIEVVEDFSVKAGEASMAGLPKWWLYSGEQDGAVPVEGTIKFAEAVKKAQEPEEVLVTICEGDHGFEGVQHDREGMRAEWCRQGIQFLDRAWLGA